VPVRRAYWAGSRPVVHGRLAGRLRPDFNSERLNSRGSAADHPAQSLSIMFSGLTDTWTCSIRRSRFSLPYVGQGHPQHLPERRAPDMKVQPPAIPEAYLVLHVLLPDDEVAATAVQ